MRENPALDKQKVLSFLKVNEGARLRSQVCERVFRNHITSAELDQLLNTVLSGLVYVRDGQWKLSKAGWREANQIAAPEPPESQESAYSDEGWTRFKQLAKENPDASAQRLLQLASKHLGDPLSDTEYWRQFRAANPEWYLGEPRTWYAPDVELIENYPAFYPSRPLTASERANRPTSEAGWREWAARTRGASIEPLLVEMPAYECANILKVCKKVGMVNALDIFGQEKIDLAHRLAGIANT